MAINTHSGKKLYISAGLPATKDDTGFAALTWTEIEQVGNIQTPSAGYTEVSYNLLGERIIKYAKGNIDFTPLTAEMAYEEDLTGQELVRTAHGSDNTYSFKVVTKNGETRYMTGKVFGLEEPGGGGEDVVLLNMTVRIDAAPIRVVV